MIFAGVDVGSSTTKVVLLDPEKRLLGWAVRKSGTDLAGTAEICFWEALAKAGIEERPHDLRDDRYRLRPKKTSAIGTEIKPRSAATPKGAITISRRRSR